MQKPNSPTTIKSNSLPSSLQRYGKNESLLCKIMKLTNHRVVDDCRSKCMLSELDTSVQLDTRWQHSMEEGLRLSSGEQDVPLPEPIATPCQTTSIVVR